MRQGKKKLNLGSFLVDNSQGIGAAGNLAGSLVDVFAPEESMGGGIASGALKGAGSLAALGPWGMAAGAVVGGTMGAINANKAKKEKEQALSNQRYLIKKNLMANAGNTFEHGGKILAKSLKPLKGGDLEAISDDAVVVKADNPNETDSVELESAFVDHDEVIDRENRVFSDEMFMPDGKSIAKHAKKLEKMKAEDYQFRFQAANQHIEGKLDELFNYQESMKKENNKTNLKMGGKISPSQISIGTKHEFEHTSDPKKAKKIAMDHLEETPDYYTKLEKAGLEKGGKTKVSFKKGGKIIEFMAKSKPKMAQGSPNLKSMFLNDFTVPNEVGIAPSMSPESGFKMGRQSIANNIARANTLASQNAPESSSPIDWNKGLTQAATFIPNAVNSILQKRLKTSPTPQLESQAKLKRINPNAQIADANRRFNQAEQTILSNTAQAADMTSAIGNIAAKRVAANNQIYGQTEQINAGIQAQEAGLNQGVRARNVERTNAFRDSIAGLSNKKLQMTSENVANLSEKILTQGRERNEIDRDKFAMQVIGKRYEDSGVFQRQLDELWENYKKQKGLKKDGKLNIKKVKK